MTGRFRRLTPRIANRSLVQRNRCIRDRESAAECPRAGAERDGCPYYRSLDRQNAVRRTDGQSIVLRVRMQLRGRSRERAMRARSAREFNQATELARVARAMGENRRRARRADTPSPKRYSFQLAMGLSTLQVSSNLLA